jgi:hypothetical protein
MVATAKHLISGFIVLGDIPNNDLFAFGNHRPANSSSIMGRPSTTPTEGLNLQGLNSVSKFNQPC